MNITLFCLVVGMLFATYYDIRYNRIPNKIIAILLCIRTAFGLFESGGRLFYSLGTMLIVAIVMIVLYYGLKGKIGAGDIKVVIVMAFYLNIHTFVMAITSSMCIMFVFCVVALGCKKITLKRKMPIAPFFLFGILLSHYIAFV